MTPFASDRLLGVECVIGPGGEERRRLSGVASSRRGAGVVLFAICLWGLLAALYAGGIGGRLSPETLTPASAESLRADSVLASRFGAGDPHLVLLAEAPGSVDEPLAAKSGRDLTHTLAADPRTAWVRGYWPYRLQEFRSPDRRHALVLVRFRGDERAVRSAGDDAIARYTGTVGPLRVAAAGETAVLSETERLSKRGLLRAEIVTVPLVLLILLWTFRSAFVALIPMVVGILAVVTTTALLRLLTNVASVSVFALNVTTALGFGLAVDYSLLLVSRYREELARGTLLGRPWRRWCGRPGVRWGSPGPLWRSPCARCWSSRCRWCGRLPTAVSWSSSLPLWARSCWFPLCWCCSGSE